MRSNLRFATSIAILLLSGVPLFVFWGLTWISPWGFISLDDNPNFVRNPLVAGALTWDSAVQCFTNESLLAVYEPISVLFRLVCVSIFGMHARAIVLVSLTLHITNAILLFVASLSTARLASDHRGRPSTRAQNGSDSNDRQMGACCGALLGAMWWAVSPQRVEAIAWPSAHGYSLSTVFCLLGWNLRVLRLRKLQGIKDAGGMGVWAYNVAALLCFTTACFCKTSALPWVAAVAVLELILLSLLPDARHSYFRRVLLEWLVPGLLVSAVCARLAVVANHTASGNQTNDYWSHERKLIGSDKLARACLALWLTVARNTFCPPGWFNTPVSAVRYAVPMRLPLLPLHLDMVERMFGTSKTGTNEETDGSAHAAIYMSLTPWCVLATIICTICSVQKCLQLAWRVLISRSSAPSTRSFVRESFAVAWVAYAILMAPSLGFVQHGFLSITADRYSYLPSVIIAPILAGFGTWVGVCRGKSRSKLGPSIVIFVVLLLCFQARDAMHGLHRFGDSSRFWLSAIAADHTYGSAHVSAADLERKAAEMLPRGSDGAKMHNSQALKLYERALKLVPTYAAGWSNYGIALMNANDLQAAITAQRRAKRLAPHFVAARFNLGAALQFAGDENSAEKEYEELQLDEPSFLPAFIKHGALLHRRGRIQEALLKYNGALSADPYNVDVLANSCLAHMNLSPPELDKAQRLCRRALQINPLHSQSKHHLQKIAVLLKNDGQRFSQDQPQGKAGGRNTMDGNQGVKRQRKQAKKRKVAKGASKSSNLDKEKSSLQRAQRPQEAVNQESKSCTVGSRGLDNCITHTTRSFRDPINQKKILCAGSNAENAHDAAKQAAKLHSGGNASGAARLYRCALLLDPLLSAARYNLAVILQTELLDEKGAIAEFERIQIDAPNFAAAFQRHGVLLHRRGQLHEALSKYDAALHAEPHNADVLSNACLAHMNLSPPELKEASLLCRRALEVDPNHKRAQQNLKAVERATNIADNRRSEERAQTARMNIRQTKTRAKKKRKHALDRLKRKKKAAKNLLKGKKLKRKRDT